MSDFGVSVSVHIATRMIFFYRAPAAAATQTAKAHAITIILAAASEPVSVEVASGGMHALTIPTTTTTAIHMDTNTGDTIHPLVAENGMENIHSNSFITYKWCFSPLYSP